MGKGGEKFIKEVPKEFIKPWDTITQDTLYALSEIITSYKHNNRVIRKANNEYEKYSEKRGKKSKVLVKQIKGDNWAIRKSLHQDTVSGLVKLKHIKVPDGKNLTATRKRITDEFTVKTIESITDTGIQKILLRYLEAKNSDPKLAFSAEGLYELNKDIGKYNNGKSHQPIFKVRIFELGSKFQLGQTGNKKDKWVEAAKGTNLFFAIYENESGKRNYETIPLNFVIERQKQRLGPVPELNRQGWRLKFYLSPYDLVYVPTRDQIENNGTIDWSNKKEISERTYQVRKFTNKSCYFLQSRIAHLIVPYSAESKFGEFESQNLSEKSLDDLKIADVCIKLNVDRIGNIINNKASVYTKSEAHSAVSEFNAGFQHSVLKTAGSFDEMNESDAAEKASIPPELHMKNAVEQIKRIYKNELNKPIDKKLKFRK